MNPIILVILLIIFVVCVVYWLINTPAYKLASKLTYLFGLAFAFFGLLLLVAGRFGYGIGALSFALLMFWRAHSIAKKNRWRGYGCIRSAAVEIYLPPHKAKLEGMVLAGDHEGQFLTKLDNRAILELYKVFSDDEESRALLEAYMDSHFASWSDSADPTIGDRFAGTHGSSTMTEQEAYQLLGLNPTARAADISKAYIGLLHSLRSDNPAGQFIIDRLDMAQSILMSLHHQ